MGSSWSSREPEHLELDRVIGQLHTREDTRPAGDHVVSPDPNVLAEHGAAGDLRPRADAAASGDDAVAQFAALADFGPLQDNRPLDRRAGADRDVLGEDHQAADMGALGDAHTALE